eukprot:EG_transcript_3428
MVEVARRDLGAAWLFFEVSVAEGLGMAGAAVLHLMFRLTNGDAWAALVRRATGQQSCMEVALEDVAGGPSTPLPCTPYGCVQRLFEYLQVTGQDIGLAAVMLSRAAAQAGDVEAAEAVAVEAAGRAGEGPAARYFTAPLTAWAARRDPHRALRVVELMKSLGVPVSLEEYTLVLEACVGVAPYDVVATLLMHMQADLEGPLPGTALDHVQAYFSALSGWTVALVPVETDGEFRSPDGRHTLQLFEVPSELVLQAAKEIEAVACRDEHQAEHFLAFKEWLASVGGCDVAIDGANVALFEQNYTEGRFQFAQIKEVYEAAWEQQGLARRLVVLKRPRVEAAAALDAWAPAFLEELRAKNALFVVEAGYDDLFWVYAALVSGGKCITNDDLGDVIEQLRRSPPFDRWYRQRRLRYNFNAQRRARLVPPAPFTPRVQAFSGGWMLPAADAEGRWLQLAWDSAAAAAAVQASPPTSAVQHPVLCIDWGRRRLGIAVTDPVGVAVRPLGTVWSDRYGRVRQLVQQRGIRQIVIGLPLKSDGSESKLAQEVRVFCKRLEELLPDIPIALQDERHSSRHAAEDLCYAGLYSIRQRRAVVDQAAAMEILHRYLEAQGDPIDPLPMEVSGLVPPRPPARRGLAGTR